MATFVLVHGAWHGAWCWQRLIPELGLLGHEAVAIDLPCDNPDAGTSEYADIVIDSCKTVSEPAVLVGHSLGGRTIPLVASRMPVARLVFLCAVKPQPGVSPAETMGTRQTRRVDTLTPPFDVTFASRWTSMQDAKDAMYHDCTVVDAKWAYEQLRPQQGKPLTEKFPLPEWPTVPSSSILCQQDRILDPEWSRKAWSDWLGTAPLEMPGGHSPFLSRPQQLAALLDACSRQ